MQRMGWSSQKPIRQALARDDQAIDAWIETDWPRIRKCRILHATLVLEDESGFSLVSPLKATWAPCGETPVIRTQITHHQRVNALGALLVTPGGRRMRLLSRLRCKTINGQVIRAFLVKLLRAVAGPIVLVWDNHPIHTRRLVKDFTANPPGCTYLPCHPMCPSSIPWKDCGPKPGMPPPVAPHATFRSSIARSTACSNIWPIPNAGSGLAFKSPSSLGSPDARRHSLLMDQ
jgi:hypothetical protein